MKCRHCGSSLNLVFVDLGSAPPSNAYLSAEMLNAPETWYPLRVLVCETCWLVQTEDHAGREELFADDYAYFSSTSASWLSHSKSYVERMTARLGLGPESMIVEVAANDGYLLQYVKAAGIPCYGIEPTASTAAAAREKGIEIEEKFFGVELALSLVAEERQADLIAANNVLAHVPDINDFVSGFAVLLKSDGVATFEFPHLLKLVAENQFDTIYHEHYSYLSLTAVARIFAANGLDVFDVEELPTHGGSLRVFAQKVETGRRERTERLAKTLNAEKEAGVEDAGFYSGFQARAENVKNDFLAFLIDIRRKGLKLGAYGAAAKGNTLMNFAGIRPDLIPYVVDRAAAKQGKFMPGSRIPIVTEAHMEADQPDLVVILPWNIKEEVMKQLSDLRSRGTRFVTAVPQLAVSD
ncbi:class I SAM-dependent methyltransferase [Parvibaculum sp.]|uniref:class I SAM-dependent methyltransferase n=1 Tax=Parvibaculum sp. TaxID=2024848 RepID=UPI001B2BF627|nr:class I SAM-dependent methyltransferase [Parvibaculum sp.]MBO6634030.1 class I SAM-dependent methyltransferase [Parvibaculum sp.]MBO6678916.1 class I SAM-dependent methyltransferase [Parvibaculum sp.]MBO6685526.1 class I SAM-dependent methyltransferase [Parvibaculum sp.]MBO6903422.1 class I SAM-dependent methyltransferase [Parvibaculum sp.]